MVFSQNAKMSQISLDMSDPNGSQRFRVYMEDFFQIVLSRRCIAWEISRLEICNQTPSFCQLNCCVMTKCQGLETFQQTNRISDPRNEKMWYNISSRSVPIEVAISLQHMKLTSGSDSFLSR